MATAYYSYTDCNDGTWVDASNCEWTFDLKVNDYDGWDAPNNERY
jgi:hypothetical protein